jgi:hypothetical protein
MQVWPVLERGAPSTMDLPDNLGYLAETPVPPKPGMIVGIATERLIAGGSVPERAYEQMCVPEWRAFCHAVWHAEVPGTCKLITRHLASSAGGKAGSGVRKVGSPEVPGSATALSARTRATIEDEGLTQLGALQEIAHLLVDDDIPEGHRPRYIQKFVELMGRWISPQVATDWYTEWTGVLRWVDDHEGWPPGAAAGGSS